MEGVALNMSPQLCGYKIMLLMVKWEVLSINVFRNRKMSFFLEHAKKETVSSKMKQQQ